MKEEPMAYLDVSPMMIALRTTPEEFSLSRSGTWLKHHPSRHSFRFDPGGHVEVRARCNCSYLEIRRSQEDELAQCFEEWQARYWVPQQINKEFASHFPPRSAVRRFLLAMTGKLQDWLLRAPSGRHADSADWCPAE
jgi:hypothetical protein